MCDHCGCRQRAIGTLMDDHEVLSRLGDDVRRAVTRGDEAAARRALDELAARLEPHAAWEEAGLFRRLVEQGDFADHVAGLEAEHGALHAALAAAEGDPRGWAAAIGAALDELDRHIYRENFGLFPAAISVLDADDWAAVDAARPAAPVR